MTSTGILRSVDHLGRIVLPKELRTAYGITPETPLEIFTENDMILLRRYRPAGGCALCGELTENCVELHGKRICKSCCEALKKL